MSGVIEGLAAAKRAALTVDQFWRLSRAERCLIAAGHTGPWEGAHEAFINAMADETWNAYLVNQALGMTPPCH